MNAQSARRWDRETAFLAWLAACVSLFSFLFYFRRGDILLYGDAVAHINIARRVFDSRTPGLLQLGTVWLPLPHLLMLPFLISDWMWRTGVGGSIPSMLSYVFGTLGIFRLVRARLSPSQPDSMVRVAAWGAAIIYAANPNLIYMQATAMTESLYLALFVWSAFYFSEFVRQWDKSDVSDAGTPLFKCGICLAAACLTRYDAWFLAVAMIVAACLLVILEPKQVQKPKQKRLNPSPRRILRNFVLLAAAAPALWLAYNAIVYRNPLEFANGPYSAKAIEMRTPGASHPGSHDLPVAFSFFLKSAELNMASGNWQKLWIVLAVAVTLICLIAGRRSAAWNQSWPLFLLWIPLPFYILSVAYSGVPIFMPVWWPYSYYNVRYGLELLPAFAVFAAVAFYFLATLMRKGTFRLSVAAAALIVIAGSYASIWRDPVCFREAWVNSRSRVALERELADFLKALPSDSTMLMYLGNHVGALQQASIPLRRVINEGNHRTWKQPVDLDGLWERALTDPAKYVNFVIAFEGDPVSIGLENGGLQNKNLSPLAVIHVSGEPKATVYQTQARAR